MFHAIRYLLPVLWMSHIFTQKQSVISIPKRSFASRAYTYYLVRLGGGSTAGAKCAVFDCIVNLFVFVLV